MIITETKRLIIRHMKTTDFNDLHAMNSDPEVCKYILGRPFTYEENQNFLKSYIEYYKKQNGLGLFAAECKQTGTFIGWVCLRPFFKEEIEVGYRMPQRNWGKGYATEMASAIVDYGFNKLQLPEIAAIVNPQNKASQNVLSKCGLKYVRNMDYVFHLSGVDNLVHFQYWLKKRN